MRQPAEVVPAGLHFAVVAVADEFLQGVLRVRLAPGVVVVLDAVCLDAPVVRREGEEMPPGLRVGANGVEEPFFENEALRVEVRRDGETGRGHFPQPDQAPAALDILLAPVAALAPRGEMLDGFAVVDALLGAVDPAEAQRDFHGVDIAHDAGTVGRGAVDPQPEIGGRGVVLLVPAVQLFPGMYVKQTGDFHGVGHYLNDGGDGGQLLADGADG